MPLDHLVGHPVALFLVDAVSAIDPGGRDTGRGRVEAVPLDLFFCLGVVLELLVLEAVAVAGLGVFVFIFGVFVEQVVLHDALHVVVSPETA